jgi:hypothetical protein
MHSFHIKTQKSNESSDAFSVFSRNTRKTLSLIHPIGIFFELHPAASSAESQSTAATQLALQLAQAAADRDRAVAAVVAERDRIAAAARRERDAAETEAREGDQRGGSEGQTTEPQFAAT